MGVDSDDDATRPQFICHACCAVLYSRWMGGATGVDGWTRQRWGLVAQAPPYSARRTSNNSPILANLAPIARFSTRASAHIPSISRRELSTDRSSHSSRISLADITTVSQRGTTSFGHAKLGYRSRHTAQFHAAFTGTRREHRIDRRRLHPVHHSPNEGVVESTYQFRHLLRERMKRAVAQPDATLVDSPRLEAVLGEGALRKRERLTTTESSRPQPAANGHAGANSAFIRDSRGSGLR